jgi:3D (Asp-Asp-Asp) domain-containing protein/CII-binding regulator of phage lambda lysogenization HflD
MLASVTKTPRCHVLWYCPALVRRLVRLRARPFVVGVCCAICGAATAAGGAETPKGLQQRADVLRRQNATLAQRMQSATLDLYSLDSTLKREQTQLSSLSVQRQEIARERRSIRIRLDSSRHDLRISQRQLSILVHTLYEQQPNDPLAVVLGAQSLDEAITTLDDLRRTAEQSQQIATLSRAAQISLGALTRKLAREDERVRALETAASRSAASLAAADTTRRHYVSTLAERRQLNSAQISRIGAEAQASVAASVSSVPVATAAPGNRTTVTVVATGYSIGGATATGLPAGWGTVAVDPSVIPLGSRMTIPGYGQGVAADTGSAVQGATVDLWFPTVRQALAWGRRLVTVTLH